MEKQLDMLIKSGSWTVAENEGLYPGKYNIFCERCFLSCLAQGSRMIYTIHSRKAHRYGVCISASLLCNLTFSRQIQFNDI